MRLLLRSLRRPGRRESFNHDELLLVSFLVQWITFESNALVERHKQKAIEGILEYSYILFSFVKSTL